MKLLPLLCAFIALCLVSACTKTETEPLADVAKLQGTWKSSDFPIAVTVDFTTADKTAKITQVASNTYSFRTGDLFWKEVVPTGASTFRLAQLTKSKSGYYVFQTGKATLVSDTQLDIQFSGDSDDTGLLKLDGKKATFTKQ